MESGELAASRMEKDRRGARQNGAYYRSDPIKGRVINKTGPGYLEFNRLPAGIDCPG